MNLSKLFKMLRLRAALSGFVIGIMAGLTVLAVAQGGIGITGTSSDQKNSIFQVGILRVTRETAITATVGGAQTGAYQLTYGLNTIKTVASSGDSVKLPVCLGGKVVIVINSAASNASNIYGQTGETINALSANSAFSLAANKVVIFYCGVDGAWFSNLTA